MSSRAPVTAVIIPAYNRAHVLGATLESVFGQTAGVAQVVVVDDGSTDDTAGVVRELLRQHPDWNERLTFAQQKNGGKSVALNHGLSLVRPDCTWIAFNDSDDAWLPHKLETQFAVLAQHPDCGACIADTTFGRSGRQTTFQLASRVFPSESGRWDQARSVLSRQAHGVMMQTAVVSRETMSAVGEFDPRLRVSQDVDFLFRVSLVTNICYVNHPLVELDRAEETGSRLTVAHPMNSPARLRLRVYMIEKWLTLLSGADGVLRTSIQRQLCSARSALANALLREGKRSEALGVLKHGWRAPRDFRLIAKWAAFLLLPGIARRKLQRA